MTKTDKQIAFELLMEEELKLLVANLGTAGRSVYAIVVSVEPPEKSDGGEIEYRGNVYRYHTDDLTKTPASIIRDALKREAKRIEELL